MDRKRSPEIEPAGKQARILLILISSMSVLVAQTFPGNDRGKLTRSAIFDVARFKSRHLSFPRSPWECRNDALRRLFERTGRDAERRRPHSHGDRGNENSERTETPRE